VSCVIEISEKHKIRGFDESDSLEEILGILALKMK
jgi:hypothetical protein